MSLATLAHPAFAAPPKRPKKKKPPPAVTVEPEPPPAPAPAPPAPVTPAPTVAPATSASSGQEVVETIDLGDGAPASVPATTPPAPPAEDRTEVRAWVRSRLSVQAPAPAIPAGEPPGAALPFDRITHDDQLFLRVRWTHARTFEVVASGFLSWTLWEADAPAGQTFNGLNGSTRGSFEPSLREAYVGFFWPRLDLRLGQQRIAWGKADAFTPNDVLNPRDLREQVLVESDVQRIPVPAARADVYFGDHAALQLDVLPFFIPNRFDVWGSNWALVQPDAPAALRATLSAAESSVDPSVRELIQPVLQQTSRPRQDLTQPSAGARFSVQGEHSDAAAYYLFGFSPSPYFRVDPGLGAILATAPSADAALAQILAASRAGQPLIASTYERNHHVGVDAQTTVGSFVLKLDAAFDSNVPFVRRDFTAVLSPAVQGVAAVEYQSGELGKTVLLEGWYQRVLDAGDAPLLAAARDGAAASLVARWLFFDHLEVELRGVQWLSPVGTLARPQVAWKTGGLEVRLGAVILAGSDGSFARYYRRNDGGYVIARYSF